MLIPQQRSIKRGGKHKCGCGCEKRTHGTGNQKHVLRNVNKTYSMKRVMWIQFSTYFQLSVYYSVVYHGPHIMLTKIENQSQKYY